MIRCTSEGVARTKSETCWSHYFACTLGPAYKEFGYNEYPAIINRFLCTILIDSNVKKFVYNGHPSTTSSFFCIFLLVISGTQCTWSFKRNIINIIKVINWRIIIRCPSGNVILDFLARWYADITKRIPSNLQKIRDMCTYVAKNNTTSPVCGLQLT